MLFFYVTPVSCRKKTGFGLYLIIMGVGAGEAKHKILPITSRTFSPKGEYCHGSFDVIRVTIPLILYFL